MNSHVDLEITETVRQLTESNTALRASLAAFRRYAEAHIEYEDMRARHKGRSAGSHIPEFDIAEVRRLRMLAMESL